MVMYIYIIYTYSWAWWADSSCRSRETSGALEAEHYTKL